MEKLISIFLIILISTSFLDSKNLFFKDLTTHPLYNHNHIFRVLDTVTYKDSIMYVQEADYLLVSINNTIVNLNIYTLEELQRLTVSPKWSPDLCFVDNQAPDYPCHIFGYWSKIIALEINSEVNQLFVCNHDGRATYHNLKTLEVVMSSESGCPPLSMISMFSSDQHFYVGDVKGGRKILRFQPKFPITSTTIKKNNLFSYINSFWLQQNDYLQFVFIFENENFIYFLFRETSEEDTNYCEAKIVKSRISRISKDDDGGANYRLVNNWITFVKANIICFDDESNNVDSTLRYIEAAYYDNERKFLYATFSSGRSGPKSSAVCQYTINDIDTVLDGVFMNIKDPKIPVPNSETSCPKSNKDCQIQWAVKYQLKFFSVIPSLKRNLVRQNEEIWTHIQVTTINRSSRQYDIIFIATSNNKIKKFYRKLTDNFLCYSETLSLSTSNNDISSIRDMRIINSKKSPQLFLLITVKEGIYKIGVEHCQIHLTEFLCEDPFCYWETSLEKCKSIFQLEVYKLRQLPQMTHCTDGSELSDHMWEQWTSWQRDQDNNCESRVRTCKEGYCANVGNSIRNIDIQVKNCSQHSQWSSWSTWSSCSSTCGPGISTRKRWCFQNPSCPGNDTESQSCIIKNQCKGKGNILYNSWSDWSKCSTDCGEGVILRSKKCLDSMGIEDDSCKLMEYKKCFGNNCKEFSVYVKGDQKNETSKDIYLGKCHGNVSGTEDLKAEIEYEVFQNNDTLDLIWDCWSDWSNCSGYCSGAPSEDSHRSRSRSCRIKNQDTAKHLCLGPYIEDYMCKEENCLDSRMSETNDEKGYQLVYIILVGVASFTATCLIVIVGVCIYFSKHKPISKLTSFNTDIVTTLNRRPTYTGNSYSPKTQSPSTSPSYMMDKYQHDLYSTGNRAWMRGNQSPTYMAPPTVPSDVPAYSMH